MAQGGQPIFILPEGTNRSVGRILKKQYFSRKSTCWNRKNHIRSKGMDKMLVDGLGVSLWPMTVLQS